MKRAILRLTAEEFGRSSLNLGRADENIAVRVEIDLSRILAQEPTAKAYITVESPSGAKYPAVTSMDGAKLIWDVTDADTAVEGTGCAQLTVKGPHGEALKSAVAATRIGHSIRGEGPAPDPVQNWIDKAEEALAKVASTEVAMETATAAANTAAGAANTAAAAATSAANAANSGETARVAAEKNRVNAETARANAETARANAETQRANAEGARATAEQGRVAAEQGRVAAEQERASAETARETAEAARRAALGGLSFAVNEDDGGLDITYTYTETEG